MSYPINYPTPQRSNFQAFYGPGSSTSAASRYQFQSWIKPQGVSMVRMMLIGGGGGGGASTVGTSGGGGGGSGAVTQWIGPAMFIPDRLLIRVGPGGEGGQTDAANGANGLDTYIYYQEKTGTGYTLLAAGGGGPGTGNGSGGAGSTAFNNNYFGAAGIFRSIAGQTGTAQGSAVVASTATFLSGGSGGGGNGSANGGTVGGKFGYPTLAGGVAGTTGTNGSDGYFLMQPIMVGFGGAGGGGTSSVVSGRGGNGGIGCGGGGGGYTPAAVGRGGKGGDGAVFIWSW